MFRKGSRNCLRDIMNIKPIQEVQYEKYKSISSACYWSCGRRPQFGGRSPGGLGRTLVGCENYLRDKRHGWRYGHSGLLRWRTLEECHDYQPGRAADL